MTIRVKMTSLTKLPLSVLLLWQYVHTLCHCTLPYFCACPCTTYLLTPSFSSGQYYILTSCKTSHLIFWHDQKIRSIPPINSWYSFHTTCPLLVYHGSRHCRSHPLASWWIEKLAATVLIFHAPRRCWPQCCHWWISADTKQCWWLSAHWVPCLALPPTCL